jgi:toxin FitB
LSETRKKQPDAHVMAFLSNAVPAALYLSCLSLGELKKGVALKMKPEPSADKAIATWVDGLETNFADRISPSIRLYQSYGANGRLKGLYPSLTRC